MCGFLRPFGLFFLLFTILCSSSLSAIASGFEASVSLKDRELDAGGSDCRYIRTTELRLVAEAEASFYGVSEEDAYASLLLISYSLFGESALNRYVFTRSCAGGDQVSPTDSFAARSMAVSDGPREEIEIIENGETWKFIMPPVSPFVPGERDTIEITIIAPDGKEKDITIERNESGEQLTVKGLFDINLNPDGSIEFDGLGEGFIENVLEDLGIDPDGRIEIEPDGEEGYRICSYTEKGSTCITAPRIFNPILSLLPWLNVSSRRSGGARCNLSSRKIVVVSRFESLGGCLGLEGVL